MHLRTRIICTTTLWERFPPERDTSRNPLFDVMFSLQNFRSTDLSLPELKVTPFPFETNVAQFDLTLDAVEKDETFHFTFEYRTRLFGKQTVERFAAYFRRLTEIICETPDIIIADIDLLSEEERREFPGNL